MIETQYDILLYTKNIYKVTKTYQILYQISTYHLEGCHDRDRMVVGFTATYEICASITTKVVSLNTAQGEVYNIM